MTTCPTPHGRTTLRYRYGAIFVLGMDLAISATLTMWIRSWTAIEGRTALLWVLAAGWPFVIWVPIGLTALSLGVLVGDATCVAYVLVVCVVLGTGAGISASVRAFEAALRRTRHAGELRLRHHISPFPTFRCTGAHTRDDETAFHIDVRPGIRGSRGDVASVASAYPPASSDRRRLGSPRTVLCAASGSAPAQASSRIAGWACSARWRPERRTASWRHSATYSLSRNATRYQSGPCTNTVGSALNSCPSIADRSARPRRSYRPRSGSATAGRDHSCTGTTCPGDNSLIPRTTSGTHFSRKHGH